MTETFTDRGLGYQSKLHEANPLEKALLNAAPQSALVLEYLASGRGLSGLIAHTVLGVTSLTTRISELRKVGVPIQGNWHQDHSGKRFMVYHYAADTKAEDCKDEPLQNNPAHPVLAEGEVPVYDKHPAKAVG